MRFAGLILAGAGGLIAAVATSAYAAPIGQGLNAQPPPQFVQTHYYGHGRGWYGHRRPGRGYVYGLPSWGCRPCLGGEYQMYFRDDMSGDARHPYGTAILY